MKKILHFTLLLFVLICFNNCSKETPQAPEDISFKTSFRPDTTIILKVNDTYKVNIIPGNAKVEMTIIVDNLYKTSKNGVITIDETGEIKAVGAGKAFVVMKNNAERITFNVVVVELPSKLFMSDSLILIKTGRGHQLFNQHLNDYEVAFFGGIKWEASDSSIVRVSNSGYVTALKEGNTKVKVSMLNYPDINSECSVQTVDHIVYLAGTKLGNDFHAVCWRHNIHFKDLSGDITTYGMLFLNDILYLAGYELIVMSDDYNKAFLITNNTKFIFPESGAAAMGITHSGSDIYICGSYTINGIRTVALWKNSVLNPILSAAEITTESRGRCVAVSANDIYVGGFIKNSKGIQVACYWKNKQRNDLSDGIDNSVVNSIFIDGSDVYAAGYYEGIVNGYYGRIGCFWKNGLKYNLTSGRSEANSIYVSNGNFYITGSYMNNNNDVASYWKNGIKYDLPLGTGAVSGYALSIEIIEGIEYISGYYTTKDYYPNNFNKSIGCYWKKGIRYDIPTYSIVNCMAID